jgi:hypothetical protein
MSPPAWRNNIAYGDPWARLDLIEDARPAQLHAYYQRSAERYRTVVGERGASLSGGQRQSMSIARSSSLACRARLRRLHRGNRRADRSELFDAIRAQAQDRSRC